MDDTTDVLNSLKQIGGIECLRNSSEQIQHLWKIIGVDVGTQQQFEEYIQYEIEKYDEQLCVKPYMLIKDYGLRKHWKSHCSERETNGWSVFLSIFIGEQQPQL
eukprot:TRINITY_DN149085_c0_g1_i1.p2 TRINITY_DN149085_c0_g1~~TRINITY_DN149085_c0_g1_i1.p2  ORF type:complete len:104 (-),score=8.39 TRINITY_DN149085_c0_g1_i1:40-351(-)